MPPQYKICTFLRSPQRPNGSAHGGGKETGGRPGVGGGGGRERGGYGNKVELCFVCCPLHIPRQN